MKLRIGYGIDVHRLEAGIPLVVGGVKIESELGAVGHSDADVLIHAICDALLGAADLRDIGYHFSDKDPQYKGIDSKILLVKVIELLKGKGLTIGNIDSTVVLETPKLNPHIPEMKLVLSDIMGIDPEDISIKATTHEKVDSFGESKAIKAYASCLLTK